MCTSSPILAVVVSISRSIFNLYHHHHHHQTVAHRRLPFFKSTIFLMDFFLVFFLVSNIYNGHLSICPTVIMWFHVLINIIFFVYDWFFFPNYFSKQTIMTILSLLVTITIITMTIIPNDSKAAPQFAIRNNDGQDQSQRLVMSIKYPFCSNFFFYFTEL